MTALDEIIYRIPIYRESRDEFYRYLQKERDKRTESNITERAKFDPEDAARLRDWYAEHPIQPNPDKIAWRYNRIVGWIEFFLDGTRLKADLWLARGNRIPRNFRKTLIDYRSKLGDVRVLIDPSSDEVRTSIIEFLEAVMRGECWIRLKNYHIDIDNVRNELRYMDLRQRMLDLGTSTKSDA